MDCPICKEGTLIKKATYTSKVKPKPGGAYHGIRARGDRHKQEFMGCTRYPICRYTEPLKSDTGHKTEKSP